MKINSKSHNDTINIKNNSWRILGDENIKFKYPVSWYVRSNQSHGTTWYRLTDDPDTTTVFFPVEIWEFSPGKASYKDFLGGATYEYFIHETDGKNGSLLSTEPSKFKNFQANRFEYNKNGASVEIITVNAISKYYMLVNYKNDSTAEIGANIFNSIIISN